MSTAALNVRSVPETHQLCRVRETHLPCAACAKRTSPQSTINLCSLCSFVTSGERPSPRPWKKRDSDPKNVEHIGRTNVTTPCRSTASGIRRPIFAARRKHENMLTGPCHRVRKAENSSPQDREVDFKSEMRDHAAPRTIPLRSICNSRFADVNGGPARADKNVRPPEF
jgi:hypothetical protein